MLSQPGPFSSSSSSSSSAAPSSSPPSALSGFCCVVDDLDSVRRFVRSLQTLAKIGPEISLESSDMGLIARALNDGQSAYAVFYFPIAFFHSFSHSGGSDDEEIRVKPPPLSQEYTSLLKLKLSSKLLSSLFRHLNSMTRLSLRFLPQCLELHFSHSASPLSRVYRLPATEISHILQAEFARTQAKSVVAIDPRKLQRCLGLFSKSVLEVSFTFQPSYFTITSHSAERSNAAIAADAALAMKDVKQIDKSLRESDMHTAYSFHVHELSDYRTNLPSTSQLSQSQQSNNSSVSAIPSSLPISFAVRELKAFLSWCELFTPVIHLSFDAPAAPVLFSNSAESFKEYMRNRRAAMATAASQEASGMTEMTQQERERERRERGNLIFADIVVATLQDEYVEQHQHQQQQQQHVASRQPSAVSRSPHPFQPAIASRAATGMSGGRHVHTRSPDVEVSQSPPRPAENVHTMDEEKESNRAQVKKADDASLDAEMDSVSIAPVLTTATSTLARSNTGISLAPQSETVSVKRELLENKELKNDQHHLSKASRSESERSNASTLTDLSSLTSRSFAFGFLKPKSSQPASASVAPSPRGFLEMQRRVAEIHGPPDNARESESEHKSEDGDNDKKRFRRR